MALFQPRAINSKTQHHQAIPLEHFAILEKWIAGLKQGRFEGESQNDDEFITQILKGVLGYTRSSEGENYSLAKNIPLETGKNVDVALGVFRSDMRKIYAPFELKGAKTTNLDAYGQGRMMTPVQQAASYAALIKGARFYLVSNYREIRLYGVGYGNAHEVFYIEKLLDSREYARFMLILGSENFLNGKTAQLLVESEKIGKDITNELYHLYKGLREELIDDLKAENAGLDALEAITYAQTTLDRVLFTAFAQSKGLLPQAILEKTINHVDPYFQRPSYSYLQQLFVAIDKGSPPLNVEGYNGGLFAQNPTLDALKVSNGLCKKFLAITQYDFETEVSVTVLGHIFEQSITDIETLQALAKGQIPQEKKGATTGKRKREGVVYTPPAITDFILEQTLGTYIAKIKSKLLPEFQNAKGGWKNGKGEQNYLIALREALHSLKVLDSSCGSGAFLVAAFDFLALEYTDINERLAAMRGGQIDIFDMDKEILTSNLYGVDVNFESIEITKLSLWLKTAKRGKILNSLDDNIKLGDSLIEDSNFTHRSFVWREDFKAIMEGGGFDVVIGNPPYVRQELFSHLKLYLERRYESYHGVADLFCYFYENGLRLLKQGGHLGYVSSSTFFRTGSGKNLRTHLQANTSLLSVLDFGDLQVFEGVTTYPAILVMTKQPAPADHCFNYMQLTRLPVKIDENTEEKIKDFFTEGAFAIPQSRLNIEGWKFENDALATLRAKIIDGKQTLKQVYGSPLYGIKTGLNKAFVINGATREALIAQDPDCESLIKPFLEGKDLKSWRQEPRDLWLIALTKGFTNSHGNFDTYDEAFAWFSKTYPSLAEWLEPFTEQAKWRTDMGDYWWELRACAYYEEFSKPKIVYAHFQPRPLFSFDTRGSFSNDKSYILPNIGFYELALLNSPVMWFVVKGKSPAVRGKFYELRSQYVDTFPIPSATPAQKQAIAALALKAQTIAESRYCVEQDFIARIRDFGDKKLTERLKNWYEGDFQAFRKDVTGVFKADIPLKERKDWEAFFGEERAKHTALTSTLNVTTKTLNTLVYALFNLTDQDIKLIENNV